MTAYTDFELRVRASRPGEPGPYSVDITAPAEIEGTPFALPGAADERDALLRRYANGTAGEDELRDFGQQLGAALFNAEATGLLGDTLKDGAMRLRLRVDPPELAALLWELLILPGDHDHAALSPRSVLSRYLPLPKRRPPLYVDRTLAVLVVCAEPSDLLPIDTAGTAARVRQALARLGVRAHVDVLNHANRLNLQESLQKPVHVLHFAGHGSEHAALALEGTDGRVDWVTADEIRELLKDTEVRLVYLDACHSAHPGLSVARALAEANAPTVLAMRRDIVDEDALTFVQVFYSALVNRFAVDAAVAEGRKALRQRGAATWSIPLLYMRAQDGQLFAPDSFGPPAPFQVEPLPADFVPRPAEHEALVAGLLAFSHDSAPATQDSAPSTQHFSIAALTTAFAGAGGYGKTTLARAVCCDPRVRAAYPDGVLWVTLGTQPGELTGRVLDCILALSGARPGYTSIEPAAERLQRELAERTCLLVVDDVWNAEHLRPFVRGGPRCARLITTRNRAVLPADARTIDVDAMRPDEAVALLGAGLPADAFALELRALAERLCEWPQLLRLAGGVLRDRVKRHGQDLSSALGYLQRLYDRYGLTAFDAANPQAREQAVAASFAASLEQLGADERARFAELAIFPEDADVPLATVQRLWGATGGLDDLETERLCERVDDLGLLLRLDLRAHTLRLHDVTRKYLMGTWRERLLALHESFLDAYRVTRWVDLPRDEPYLWRHLAYHLRGAGRREELCALLTGTDEWLRRKFEVCAGDTAYAEDLELAMQDFVDPLTSPEALAALVRLHAARQVVRARVGTYTDEMLRALVWLGREEEALSHARLRDEPQGRFNGLIEVYKALQAKGTPNHILLGEASDTARSIPDDGDHARALATLTAAHVAALIQAGHFDQAAEVARSIPDEGNRVRALATLAAAHVAALIKASRLDQAAEAARSIPAKDDRVQAFAALAAAFAQAGRLDQAAEAAHNITDPDGRARTLTALAASIAQAGDSRATVLFDQAIEVARSIPDHGDRRTRGLADLAAALAKAALFDQATEVARGITGRKDRARALADLVAALARAGRFNQAAEVASSIPAAYDHDRAHAVLVAALRQAGRFDQASEVARGILADDDRALALADIAVALTKAGDPRATTLFDEAAKVAYSILPNDDLGFVLHPRIRALAGLAITLAEVGDPNAVALFDQAADAVHNITDADGRAIMLTSLAFWLTHAGDSRATVFFDQAGEVARSIPDDDHGRSIARSSALATLAATLTQVGGFDQAADVAHSITDDNDRDRALAGLTVALVQAGRYDKALDVARSITDHSLIGHAETLTDLAIALAHAGDPHAAAFFDQVADAARSIPDVHRRVSTRAHLVTALIDLATALTQVDNPRAAAFFDQAVDVARSISPNRTHGNALAALAAALAQAGRFNQAFEAAQSIRDGYRLDRARTFTDLAVAFAQAGDPRAPALFNQAADVARGHSDDLDRGRALALVAVALAQAGRFDQAFGVARSIPDDKHRDPTLADIAAALAQTGRFDQAAEVAHSIPYDYERARALVTLAAALAQAGRFSQAAEVTRSIPDEDQRDGALTTLAAALAKAGYFDQAAEVTGSISDNFDRARMFTDLAVAFAQAGDPRAPAFFDQAAEVTHSIPNAEVNYFGFHTRAFALASLAGALAKAGRFDQAFDIARSISDEGQRGGALAGLALALATTERFDQAFDIARSISDEGQRDGALARLALALATAERFDQAFDIARSISDEGQRNSALASLAPVLAKAGYFDQAADAAHNITDADDRVQALTALATVLAQISDPRAAAILDQAAKVAQAGHFDRASKVERSITVDEDHLLALVLAHRADKDHTLALADLAIALVQAGRFDQATEVADNITYDFYRVAVLSELATVLAQVSDPRAAALFDQAAKVAHGIPDDHDRALALARLAAALAQAGHFDIAADITRSITHDAEAAQQLAYAGRYAIALAAHQLGSSDDFIEILATWAQKPPTDGPRIDAEMLLEAVHIVGWVDPAWRKVFE
jgi:tetratricopeptide (TPR) repeat protein/lipopolysaccharide biosynthesis regulator YciM